MLRSAAAAIVLALAACRPGDESPLRAVPFESVELRDSFWKPRLTTNRTVTIPHIFRQNEETGRVDNFRKAAGELPGRYEGRRFNDTDVYKAIEAASYALAQEPDPALEAEVDELIEIVAKAQEADGYLFPARTIDPGAPAPGVGRERWIHESAGSHELYNAGHLIEAAVAYYRATGKRSLLDVAIRFADLVDRDFGPDARRDVPGHEEIELALAKLADVTGETRYVALAKFFLDERGREHDGAPYSADTDFAIYNDLPYKQDHLPVTEQRKAVGHAVRATYLYTGMADALARTEAPGYQESLEAIWQDVVGTKLYLTGGIGSRGTFESFGEDYELPNATAYTETCAAIGNDLWNHRMFLASGDPRFLDVMEWILYNGALSGVSAKGDAFFYRNPLESSGGVERSTYFDVACCPANIARLLAHLPGFVYASRGDEAFVNLFVASEAEVALHSGNVVIEQETRYPWEGRVLLRLRTERPIDMTLHLRIPGWARGASPLPGDLYRFVRASAPAPALRVMGESVPLPADAGFASIERRWREGDEVEIDLPMPVRRVQAKDAVEGNRGRLALTRGPLLYAFEAVDNGGTLEGAFLPEDSALDSAFREDVLGGVTVVRGGGLTAVPYFAWANRGPGEMVVWMPTRRMESMLRPPS
jgi:hypothetical protein